MGLEEVIKADKEPGRENLSYENIKIMGDFVKKFALFLEENPDLIDDYDKLQEKGFLGNGGAGSVYSLNKDVCFKTMPNRPTDNNYHRYHIEALTLKRLNGVKLDTEDEKYNQLIRTPYFFAYYKTTKNREILMEKINGVNLQEVVIGKKKLPKKFYDNFFDEEEFDTDKFSDIFGEFLELVHDRGVAHNDIALRNIMVDNEGRLVLIDTGQSAFLDGLGREERNKELKKDDDEFDKLVEDLEDFFENKKKDDIFENDIQVHYDFDDDGNIETEIFSDEIILMAEKILERENITEKKEIKKGLYLTPFKSDLILGIKKINFNGLDYYLGFLKED